MSENSNLSITSGFLHKWFIHLSEKKDSVVNRIYLLYVWLEQDIITNFKSVEMTFKSLVPGICADNFENETCVTDEHIEAAAQWTPFRWRPFRMHFHKWKKCILIQTSLWFLPKGPIDKNVSIGSGNGLVTHRWQAITWTNVYPVHRHI